jgi:hypothetical protein
MNAKLAKIAKIASLNEAIVEAKLVLDEARVAHGAVVAKHGGVKRVLEAAFLEKAYQEEPEVLEAYEALMAAEGAYWAAHKAAEKAEAALVVRVGYPAGRGPWKYGA